MSASFGEILLIVALVLGIACSVAVAHQLQRFVSLAPSLAMPSAPCSAECTQAPWVQPTPQFTNTRLLERY